MSGAVFSPSYEMESSPCWMAMLYDDIDSECGGNPRASADMVSPLASFYRDELDRALSEQSFGLLGYEISGQCSAQEAAAVVTLLEGTSIRVHLNIRGYQVRSIVLRMVIVALNKCLKIDGGQVCETIEAVLQSASQMYVQKLKDKLITKLQSLQ